MSKFTLKDNLNFKRRYYQHRVEVLNQNFTPDLYEIGICRGALDMINEVERMIEREQNK